MFRVLTTQFDTSRRCMRCDVLLSISAFDTKPVALQLRKAGSSRLHYQCITCALKFKVSINEIRKFLHLPLIDEDEEKSDQQLLIEKNILIHSNYRKTSKEKHQRRY